MHLATTSGTGYLCAHTGATPEHMLLLDCNSITLTKCLFAHSHISDVHLGEIEVLVHMRRRLVAHESTDDVRCAPCKLQQLGAFALDVTELWKVSQAILHCSTVCRKHKTPWQHQTGRYPGGDHEPRHSVNA